VKLVFHLTDTNTATLAVTPLAGSVLFTNLALAGTADSGIDQVRLFNFNAGAASSTNDAFFNRASRLTFLVS